MIWGFALALFLAPAAGLWWTFVFDRLRHRWRWMRWRGFVREWLMNWISGGACGLTAAVIQHDWGFAGGAATTVVIAASIWWRRKNRGKARAWLGAKSRALGDALVQRMPKPVMLRPVRGGAS